MSRQPVIDGLEFARTGSKLQGALPVAGFLRMRDSLCTNKGTVRYELLGVPEELGRPALRLRVGGELQFVCQRCLGALQFPLHIDVSLQLAATQAELDAAPLAAEGPEWIVAGPQMPVCDLIEDELLLAIPLVLRHEGCAGGEPRAVNEGRSPFAGLRGLVGGAKH
jgi:uncharacterized protein